MMTNEQGEKIWSLIKGIKVGMLVSQEDDRLLARPMHMVQRDFTGTLWFFTSKQAQKTQDVVAEHQVCVAFADHGSETYVSLNGTANLTQDRAKIDSLWNPFVSAYFPGGKNDPNLTLLEISVEGAEYWDSTSSRMVQLFAFLKANVTKEPPQLGEHRKIGAV